MKKLTLFSFALAATLSAGAQLPAVRSVATTYGSVKEINRRQHAITERPLSVRKTVAEVPENSVEVPFTHDLGKNGTEVKNYTAINVNGDNRKWQFGAVNGYAACMVPNEVDVNDDWLITVPVHMTAGNYVLSFEVGFMGSGAKGVELEAWVGREATVEGMLAEVAPRTIYDVKDMTKYEFNCAIPEEGYYYFGFHCTTSRVDVNQKGTLKLANVGVREGSVTPPVVVDPPAAGSLTWTLAPKGELRSTVVYTAPTKTKAGEDLTEISKVEITSRWGVDKFVYEDVAPGQVITLENVEMYAGYNNRFTGVAFVGETAGDIVEYKNIFCGPDTPMAPTDVRLEVADDFSKATLSWTAPGEVGENGGYVDTDQLTYYVFDAFGTYYDPALYETKETSIIIEYPDLSGQDFFAYQVTAGFGEYYSLDCASNIATVGQPDQMPFTESFVDGYYDGMWLIDPESTGSNSMMYGTISDDYFASMADPDDPDAPQPLASQDGDNGFYLWLPYQKDAMLGLISVRTDISAASRPVLEFWYQGQGSLLEVLVAGGNGNFSVVKTIDLKSQPTDGWTLARIPLDEFKASGAVQFEIRLTAVHNDEEHTWSVPFDNIRIRDLAETELRLVSFSAPAKASPGETIRVKARIENLGTSAATGASAVLKAGGVAVATEKLPEMAPNAFFDTEIEYTLPLNVPENIDIAFEAIIDGEATPADNKAETNLKVDRKPFSAVTALTATVSDGKVMLTWQEPLNETGVPIAIDEDFEGEEYIPMSISGAGGWSVHDGDGVKTYNVFRELINPYQTQPMAFQLFNRVVAQVPEEFWIDAEPHSGDSFMMAASAVSMQNDNWLISPELSGNAQTVTFWARSFSSAWPETFKVYYSVTGNDVESFTASVEISGMADSGEVPEVWTEFSFVLPEGAKYFAVNHDSYDTVALMIDDISYEALPALPSDLAVVGYHIFRDGSQLTETPVEGLSYIDSPLDGKADSGDYTFEYSVIPVYNYGPGAESEIVSATLNLSGIEQIAVDSLDADVRIYNLSGIGVARADVIPGVYIIVSHTGAVKALLK